MRTVGLVVEYNPLHNGHKYHYEQAKRQTGASAAVAVMSGHFLQRGEPALVNKWARTEMALRAGIDLVLELPFVYAAQNAEQFAYGAVATLHATGVVDSLCFGSESGDISWMTPLAKSLVNETALFQREIRQHLATGISYPAAYGRAVEALFSALPDFKTAGNVTEPNNILGLNYCMALARLQSSMKPITIQRQKAGYHQEEITDARIASATALRKITMEEGSLDGIKPYVPASTLDVLQEEKQSGRFPMSWEAFYPHLQHQLMIRQPGELAEIYEMTEGLEHRIHRSARTAGSFRALMEAIKTKRYTWNRLQRLLLYTLFGLTREKMIRSGFRQGPAYIRVLGFSETGRELLKTMKDTCALPIISKVKKEKHPMLEFDLQAGAIYALGYTAPVRQKEMQREYEQSPLRL
nr:nucleotidyltransferase [Aneurinibacillus tyrosinisolvens]